MQWNLPLVAWGTLALLLMAGEALLPGAALLWFGLAAAAMFLIVAVLPDLSFATQAALFIALSFAAVAIWRVWFRRTEPVSDQPALNRRTAQLVGTHAVLERAIENGRGRVQIADAYWDVTGPDLPVGTRVRITGGTGMTLVVEPLS